jgi:hypothetical protein
MFSEANLGYIQLKYKCLNKKLNKIRVVINPYCPKTPPRGCFTPHGNLERVENDDANFEVIFAQMFLKQ